MLTAVTVVYKTIDSSTDICGLSVVAKMATAKRFQ